MGLFPFLLPIGAFLLLAPRSLPAQAQPDAAALVEQLGNSQDYNRCYQAYLALLRSKPPEAIPLLEKSLPSFKTPALSYGVSLLRSYAREAGFPALRRLMKNGPSLLSFYCAEALFRAREKDALPYLRKALAGAADSPSRLSMVSRIQGLKDPGLQDLVRSWIRPGAGVPLLRSALTYLFSVEDPETEGVLKKLLEEKETSPEARVLSAAYLAARGDPKAGKVLAGILSPGKLPQSSFYTMIRFLKDGPRPPKKVLEAFLDLLEKEKNSSIKTSILGLFEKFPFRPSLPALRKLLVNNNSPVAQAAFDALAASPGAMDSNTLHRLLSGKDTERRLLAADTLRRMDDRSGLEAVLELVRKKGRLRSRALEILGKFRVNRAVPALLDGLEDPASSVRRAAFYGLRATLAALFPYRRLDLSSTGYGPDAPLAKRRAGAASIRAWWEKHKNGDW